MTLKIWFVIASFVFGATTNAAVPPGMQDTELKDTLVYLSQEKLDVETSNMLLIESGVATLGGVVVLGVPVLSLIPAARAQFVKSSPRFSALGYAGVGVGLVALGMGLRYLATVGRANFDRDWIIERQHFRDLRAYFRSPLEVQYVIASDNSDLRDYLMELAAWIKASKADQETVTPSLKYQRLVPNH
jgi:hypothetical protein